MKLNLLLTLIFSFVLIRLLTPCIRSFALKLKVVDFPNGRTVHLDPMPKLGGLAIYLSFWCILVGFYFVNGSINLMFTPKFMLLFSGSTLILLVGIFDDIWGANCYQKFTFQTLAAYLTIIGGYKITLTWLSPNLHWLEIPLTLLWIVGLTNAMNLIDGLDGLATGVAAIAVLILSILGIFTNQPDFVVFGIVFLGCLVSFLKYNWNPAKIFLGDTGSLFLGFILACISIEFCSSFKDFRMMMVPTLIFTFPILDTLMAMIRRINGRTHPFRADKEHIHHIILNIGVSHVNSVLILYFISASFGLLGLMYALSGPEFSPFFVMLVVIFLFFNVVGLKYLKKNNQHNNLKGRTLESQKKMKVRKIPELIMDCNESDEFR